jgi:hypothetical protein
MLGARHRYKMNVRAQSCFVERRGVIILPLDEGLRHQNMGSKPNMETSSVL